MLKRNCVWVLGVAACLASAVAQENGPVWLDVAHRPAVAVATASVTRTIPPEQVEDLRLLTKPEKDLVMYWIDQPILNNPLNIPYLRECARLFGSLGVSFWYTDEELRRAADIARMVGVGLDLNVNPWQITGCRKHPMDFENMDGELEALRDFFLRTIRLGLPVASVVYDAECQRTDHPLVTDRLNMAYNIAKSFHPEAPVYWFYNGVATWLRDAHHDDRSVVLYAPQYATHTELYFNEHHKTYPDEDWSAWITPGPGYEGGRFWWDIGLPDWQYWAFGRWLAGDQRISAVIVYPGPGRWFVPGGHVALVGIIRGMTAEPLVSSADD